MKRNKTTLGQPGANPETVLKALTAIVEARDCLDIVAEICKCGAMKHELDGSPLATVVNVAIDQVHRGIEILRGDDEIEEEAA
jgi:putative heme iron utilization protein